VSSFVLLGSPGAGKGTLGQYAECFFDVEHISSGDLLRAEIKNQTAIGQEIKTNIEEGKQVSDRLVTILVFEKIAQLISKNKQFILDGFPQTLAQRNSLQTFLTSFPSVSVVFLCVEISPEIALKRMIGRVSCIDCEKIYHNETNPSLHENQCDQCHGQLVVRSSDEKEKAIKRLELFENTTKKVMDVIKNHPNTFVINANGSIHTIRKQFFDIYMKFRHSKL
jgi:adenylate kinase